MKLLKHMTPKRLVRNIFLKIARMPISGHVIICNPVTIGENSIVGAGSVVTKDIPDGEIWAGNPACFLKKQDL